MLRINLVLAGASAPEPREFVEEIARVLRERGDLVRVLEGGFLRLSWQLLRHRSDVYDFHGGTAAFLSLIPFVTHHSAVTICTLHEREEFRPGASFAARMLARIGTSVAMSVAHDVVVTQKTIQSALFAQFGAVPTYVPHGVSERTGQRRRARRAPGIVLLTEQGHASAAGALRRSLTRARIRGGVTTISTMSAVTEARRGRRPAILPWDTSVRDELLRSARAILVLEPLQSPARLRQAACAGRPLLVLDTPEHREALGTRAAYVTDTSPETLREAVSLLVSRRRTLEQRARRAALWMERSYTWDRIADEMMSVYRKDDLVPVALDSLSPRTSGRSA
jgi:glycosyl transferase family 1